MEKPIPLVEPLHLPDGGYLVPAAPLPDAEEAVRRYGLSSIRLGGKMGLLFHSYVDFLYSNWLDLALPLLEAKYEDELTTQFADLPEEFRKAVYLAERHLYFDFMFERYLYREGIGAAGWPDLDRMEQISHVALFRRTFVQAEAQL